MNLTYDWNLLASPSQVEWGLRSGAPRASPELTCKLWAFRQAARCQCKTVWNLCLSQHLCGPSVRHINAGTRKPYCKIRPSVSDCPNDSLRTTRGPQLMVYSILSTMFLPLAVADVIAPPFSHYINFKWKRCLPVL
eukprot:90781-Amphidinium_carterae.1